MTSGPVELDVAFSGPEDEGTSEDLILNVGTVRASILLHEPVVELHGDPVGGSKLTLPAESINGSSEEMANRHETAIK